MTLQHLQRLEASRKWLILSLAATTIAALAVSLVSLYEYMSLASLSSDANVNQIPADLRNTLGQLTVGAFLPRLLLFLVTAVIFLRWTYRLFENANLLLADKNLNNPGWVVSFFIIPFMNFFLPLLSFLDLSRKQSTILTGKKDRKLTTLVISWWVFFLFSLLMTVSSGFFAEEEATVGMLRNDAITTSLSEFTLFIAGCLAIPLINILSKQQLTMFKGEKQ